MLVAALLRRRGRQRRRTDLAGIESSAGADDDDLIGGQAIPDMRWLETKTLRPSRARPLQVADPADTVRIQPVDRLVEKENLRAPSRAATMPRRWVVILRENVPARRPLTEVARSSPAPRRRGLAAGALGRFAQMDAPGLQEGADLMEGPAHVMDMAAVHGDVPAARGIHIYDGRVAGRRVVQR